MKRTPFLSLLALAIFPTAGASSATAADPVAELGAFSVFQKDVVPAQLLKGDVKVARSPAMNAAQDISVQSCYVVPGTPAKALEALQQWDASRHPELKIYVHGDLPAAPTAANFSRLESAPGNGEVRALAEKTAKASTDLQISAEEAKKLAPAAGGEGKGAFPEAARAAWAGILASRAQAFANGGATAQPGYEHTGKNVRPGTELAGLLRQQETISKQFAGFLGQNGVRGGGSLKKDLYFEMLKVDDEAVLTLGSFSSKAVGDGFQAADVGYYASGGYYATLTLYQMWPVEVDGKPATLVWRGDLIAAGSLAELHGVERLASESATMKDITKTVNLLRRDTAGR